MKELNFDIIWIFIAIVGGFSLAYLSSIYLNITDSPFYIIHTKGSSFLTKMIEILGATLYNPLTLVLIMISLAIIFFLLKLRKFLS